MNVAKKVPRRILLSDLRMRVFLDRRRSIFRHYQNLFLERHGRELEGEIYEIGGEKSYDHQRFFPRASGFHCTNVARDHDEHLDVTQMGFADSSIDGFVCVSVLEHVYDIFRAAAEITRTLRPGGKLLLVVPFGFPYHDEVDYWRLSLDAFPRLFTGLDIEQIVHLGGLFSTIADNLKRPRAALRGRFLLYKLFGAATVATIGKLERLDGIPLGYGIVATKRAA
jgi:SAM-dependent methyltransferase